MQEQLHLLRQLLCLFLRCLLVERACDIVMVHTKPPWLNFENGFLLFVSPRRLFFFNSSSKLAMNHVSGITSQSVENEYFTYLLPATCKSTSAISCQTSWWACWRVISFLCFILRETRCSKLAKTGS